jgi:hypothetical protein
MHMGIYAAGHDDGIPIKQGIGMNTGMDGSYYAF